MTNEEKRDRINQLDEEIDKLRKERDGYRKELSDERILHIQEERTAYVNKCFVLSGIYKNKPIKAFKILENYPYPRENYARCVVLYDNTDPLHNEAFISVKDLGLWCNEPKRLMPLKNDPKMIDFYDEISQEEFSKMYRKYVEDMNIKVWLDAM